MNRVPHRTHNDIPYVDMDEVQTFHGAEWWTKFKEVAGINTCPVIPNVPFAMYYWDYERYADAVDSGKRLGVVDWD